MAHQTTAKPLPDNNGCRMHKEYNFTCGTCNGYFDKDGNPTKMSTTEDSIRGVIENMWRDSGLSGDINIADDADKINEAVQAIEALTKEARESEVKLTYYKYSCPNSIHVFGLLGDTETCVYCYVEDNPPPATKKKGEVKNELLANYRKGYLAGYATGKSGGKVTKMLGVVKGPDNPRYKEI